MFSLKSSPPEIAGSNSLGSSHLACSQKDRLEDEERILILLLLLGDPLLYTMTTACRKRWFLPIAQKDGKEQREGGIWPWWISNSCTPFWSSPPNDLSWRKSYPTEVCTPEEVVIFRSVDRVCLNRCYFSGLFEIIRRNLFFRLRSVIIVTRKGGKSCVKHVLWNTFQHSQSTLIKLRRLISWKMMCKKTIRKTHSPFEKSISALTIYIG